MIPNFSDKKAITPVASSWIVVHVPLLILISPFDFLTILYVCPSNQSVVWPFLPELPIPDPVIQDNPGQCHRQPQHKVLRTDLPQEVARHSAVVPDTPAEPEIDDATGTKLEHCNPGRADQDLLPERHRPRKDLVDQSQIDEADSSQDEHCPMAPAAPDQLDQYVQ